MSALPEFAISVRQPWAWAIIYGGKDVANRTKRAITLGRMEGCGRIAIHAASGMTKAEYADASTFMRNEIGVDPPHPLELVRGGIIGQVTVTGITKESTSPWFFGPWALELTHAIQCGPKPCLGALGLFRWQEHPLEALREPLPWMENWGKTGAYPNPGLQEPTLL